jgi:6-phosphogluconate dehydrogenase
MRIGFVGFGKMGSRMVGKLLLEGHAVVAWNRTKETIELYKQKNTNQYFSSADTLEELVNSLQTPRVIWMMLPAGLATQSVFDEIVLLLDSGDILIDGGNAYYKETELRSIEAATQGVRYVGVGVSGGIKAVENGYPLMVGGDRTGYEYMRPVLDSLSKPNGGHVYFGSGGAGHYVKMVHNAIEYSYMQGIGEGFGILEKAPYKFDLTAIAKMYAKNTLVSGFMMDRTIEALQNDPLMAKIDGVVGRASGETVWAIEEAKKHSLPIENIQQALAFRNRSETDTAIQQSFAARMVSALRQAFGGHSVKKK